MSSSALSVSDRQVSGSGVNWALDSILVLYLAFQFFARIPKRMRGGGCWGSVGSLIFDVQGWERGESRPIWTHSDRQKKGG